MSAVFEVEAMTEVCVCGVRFQSNDSSRMRFGEIVVFLTTFQCLRLAARFAGHLLTHCHSLTLLVPGKRVDECRVWGEVSVEMLALIMIEIFSAVFYRNLFSSIESFTQFFEVKAARFLVDLVYYPIHLSTTFAQVERCSHFMNMR